MCDDDKTSGEWGWLITSVIVIWFGVEEWVCESDGTGAGEGDGECEGEDGEQGGGEWTDAGGVVSALCVDSERRGSAQHPECLHLHLSAAEFPTTQPHPLPNGLAAQVHGPPPPADHPQRPLPHPNHHQQPHPLLQTLSHRSPTFSRTLYSNSPIPVPTQNSELS